MIRSIARRTIGWLTSPRLTRLLGEPCFRLVGMRRNGREIDPTCLRRVLVVRLDEIGDVVMTTPFLRELRRNLPDAWITLVVKPAVHKLVELCPYVDEVLTYDWSAPGRFSQLRRHGRALELAWKYLWRRRFDLALVPRWDTDFYHATFVAYFSGARSRVGYSERVIDHKGPVNRGCDRLFTHVVDDRTLKHEVEHNLDVIRFLGSTVQEDRLELWIDKEDELFAEELLRSRGVGPNHLLIAFGPGKRDPKRRWPLLRFIELGAWLEEEYHARILIVGENEEEPLVQLLQRQLGNSVVNMVGQTTLRQATALLKHCHLYVGNDYGPKHLASAVGVPVIEINSHPPHGSPSHPDSPRRFEPWGVSYVVLQPEKALDPCPEACTATQPHCILGVTVEQVKKAVTQLFGESTSPIKIPSFTRGK